MAKRKSGALDFVKAPPTRPKGIDPYSQPYSLGDVEYLAFLRNLAKRRVPEQGSKLTELAIDDIERQTKGDFGKYIKMVTSREAPSKAEKDFISYLTSAGANPSRMKSIYGTNIRGTFFPKSSDERKVYKSKTDEPQILVQDLDQYEKQGAKYDKRDIDSRSFFEKLKEIFGIKRKFDLEKERKEGDFPTVEEMETIKMLQGMEQTKGEELDHYGIHLLRTLGYTTPESIERLGSKRTSGEEAFMGAINKLTKDGKTIDDLTDEDRDTLNKLQNLASKELKKRRGYNQGGLVDMLKSFK